MNTILELKVGDRNYLFICNHDSPLGEAHDALCQMKAHVLKLMQDAEKSKEISEGDLPVEDLNGE